MDPERVPVDWKELACPSCGNNKIFFQGGRLICNDCGRRLRYEDGRPPMSPPQ